VNITWARGGCKPRIGPRESGAPPINAGWEGRPRGATIRAAATSAEGVFQIATETLPDDAAPAAFPLAVPPAPPLEARDRLTRDEFERRYDAMPRLKKAELIEGVVYMPSHAKNSHGEPHSHMVTWLGVYAAAAPGVRTSDNATVRLDGDNEPQPDVQLRNDAACGGQSDLRPDDYAEGAPELIVETAGSSASYDLHDKPAAYRRNGVREYLVWRVHERGSDCYLSRAAFKMPPPSLIVTSRPAATPFTSSTRPLGQ
jgi:Uma2 family endonuclease